MPLDSHPPQVVELIDVPAHITVAPDAQDAEVRVSAPVALAGTAPLNGVLWSVIGPAEIGPLLVAVNEVIAAESVRWTGHTWRVSLVLDRGSQGQTDLETVLGCGLLQPRLFRDLAQAQPLPDDGAVTARTPAVFMRHTKLRIAAEPGGLPIATLEIRSGRGPVLHVIGQRANFYRVRWQETQSFRLDGWARKDALTRVLVARSSARPRPSHVRSRWPRPFPLGRSSTALVGTARRVAVDHPVTLFHARDGEAWASFRPRTREESELLVDWKAGLRWLRVIHLPGVRTTAAWIRADQVLLNPPDGGERTEPASPATDENLE